jgi:NAD(P)-dependent dehydrogenase (short-subunit alcohol dehydrogenase family)
MKLDVSSLRSVREFVAAFKARGFPRLDVLINNAGVMLNVGHVAAIACSLFCDDRTYTCYAHSPL